MVTLVFAVAIALAVAGCGQKSQNNGQSQGQQQNGEQKLSGSIQIAGSTSVQPLSEELAAAFMQKYPGVKINVAGGGSGAGIKAAQQGTADIGASSRELKDTEKGTVKETVIAKDGIAVIVHPDNPVENISMEQIKGVFTGKITNWKDLGGKDAPITVIIREAGSGTRGAFQELTIGEDAEFTDKAIIQNSNGALRTAVAGNPDAIGFISFGYINNEIKPLKVEGIEATKDNVLNGSYKISRPFLYLTKGEPGGIVKAYIDFVLSPEGHSIVGKEYIPVK
jgi:phosphate transport system substrate-binding protein